MGAIQGSINNMITSAAVGIGAAKKIGSDIKTNETQTQIKALEANLTQARYDIERMQKANEISKKEYLAKVSQQEFWSAKLASLI